MDGASVRRDPSSVAFSITIGIAVGLVISTPIGPLRSPFFLSRLPLTWFTSERLRQASGPLYPISLPFILQYIFNTNSTMSQDSKEANLLLAISALKQTPELSVREGCNSL